MTSGVQRDILMCSTRDIYFKLHTPMSSSIFFSILILDLTIHPDESPVSKKKIQTKKTVSLSVKDMGSISRM